MDAPCLRVERIDGAVLTADEQAARSHGRMRPRNGRIGKTESPLQCQSLQIGWGQPRTLRGLKARVRRRGTPSSPLRRFRKVLERGRRAATSGLCPTDVSGNRLPSDELGDGATFGPAQTRALRAHGASQQGVDDGLGTAGTKSLETRRPRVRCACVAGRAGRLKYRGPVR